MEHHELWQVTLAKIENTISRPNFLTWFRETGILSVEDNIATVCVLNGFVKEWLQNKYHKIILHALRESVPEIRDVVYIIGRPAVSAAVHKETREKRKHQPDIDRALMEEMSLKELAVNPETNLNPRYTFDTFVVGSFNELAHATAQSIIESPGTKYNPFFVYGGVGLGKTHLIQAIGNALLKENLAFKIKYLSSEKYMGEILDALRNQEMNALKEKYRSVDLLIMDDIQFIAKTEKMQEEFFHTFNSLYEQNKQIIISSDRPPHAIPTLEDRLKSRFEGGMVTDIGVPDVETRFTILKKKAELKNAILEEDILRYIAETIKTNIRELEGALNKIIITTKLSQSPITRETAEKIITQHTNAPRKFVSVKKIIRAVSEFYDISDKDLMNRSRKKDVVKPRQIAMYLIREELKSSFPSIGEKFGGRDHTTAMHSYEKIVNDLKTKPELEEEIQGIKDKIFTN